MQKTHMAIDQYGQHIDDLGPHPRKALMERLGYSHAQKMYNDTKSGPPVHTGYVVGPFWCRVFEVIPWRKK